MASDNVNSPPHYNRGNIETIDYLESTLGHQGFIDYCLGNVLKYTSRWRDKGGIEDLHKAEWYLKRAISTIEKKVTLFSEQGWRDLVYNGLQNADAE